MRVFADSNTRVSGFAIRGLCADLIRLLLRRHGLSVQLLTSKRVRVETVRILNEKFRATERELAPVRYAMALAELVRESPWEPPPGFPDGDDAAIIASALAARAETFITGDKGLLDLGKIESMVLQPPRRVYERLIG